MVSPSMTLACPIRSSARAGSGHTSINKAALRRKVIASANPVRPVQEIAAVAERRFGVLIDGDDDRLHMLIAVAFQCRLPSHVSQRIDPCWMVRLVVVPC